VASNSGPSPGSRFHSFPKCCRQWTFFADELPPTLTTVRHSERWATLPPLTRLPTTVNPTLHRFTQLSNFLRCVRVWAFFWKIMEPELFSNRANFCFQEIIWDPLNNHTAAVEAVPKELRGSLLFCRCSRNLFPPDQTNNLLFFCASLPVWPLA